MDGGSTADGKNFLSRFSSTLKRMLLNFQGELKCFFMSDNKSFLFNMKTKKKQGQ